MQRGLSQLRWLRPAYFYLKRRELYPKNVLELARLGLYLSLAAALPLGLWQLYLVVFEPMLHSGIHFLTKLVLWLSLGYTVYAVLLLWQHLWLAWIRNR